MESQRRWILRGAIGAAIVAIVAIFFFRANPPKDRVDIQRDRVAYTTGAFISGPASVPAEGYLDFKFAINGKKKLTGKFATAGYKGKVECLVLDEKSFDLFKSGGEFQKIAGTGSIPGGKIDRSLDGGTYYLVFDNRLGKEKVELMEADFMVE